MKVEFSYARLLSNLPKNLPALVLLPYNFITSANTYPRVELATTHNKAQYDWFQTILDQSKTGPIGLFPKVHPIKMTT